MKCSFAAALAWCESQAFYNASFPARAYNASAQGDPSPKSQLGDCYFEDFRWYELFTVRMVERLRGEEAWIVAGLAATLLAFLCGVAGNVLCLLAFRRQKRSGKKPYEFQVAIVTSDLLCLCIGFGYLFNNKLIFMEQLLYLCSKGAFFYLHSATTGLVMGGFLASVLVATAACVDRRMALTNPVVYRVRNETKKGLSRARLALLGAFVVAFAVALPTFQPLYEPIEPPGWFATRSPWSRYPNHPGQKDINVPAYELSQEEAFCKFVVKEALWNGRQSYAPSERYGLFLAQQNYCWVGERKDLASVFFAAYFLGWLGLCVAVGRLVVAYRRYQRDSKSKNKPEERKLYVILLVQTAFCLSTGLLTLSGIFCQDLLPGSLVCKVYTNLNYVVLSVQTASNFALFLTLSKAFRADTKAVVGAMLPWLGLKVEEPALFVRRSRQSDASKRTSVGSRADLSEPQGSKRASKASSLADINVPVADSDV